MGAIPTFGFAVLTACADESQPWQPATFEDGGTSAAVSTTTTMTTTTDGSCSSAWCAGTDLALAPGYGHCSTPSYHECPDGCGDVPHYGPVCLQPFHPCPKLFGLDSAAASGDCNGDASDGAETNLRVDPHNCGACGRDCLSATCDDGMCAPVLLDEAAGWPWGLAVGTLDIFVAAQLGIDRVPKDGGTATVFAPLDYVATAPAVRAGSVFWLRTDAPNAALWSQPEAGGASVLLAEAAMQPGSLVVDDVNAYWIEGTTLTAIPLTGGSPLPLADVGQGGLAVFGSDVFVAIGSDVLRVPVTGGAPVVFASGFENALHVAADATGVYVTDTLAGNVVRISVDGSLVTPIADHQPDPGPIALNGSAVYWIDGGGEITPLEQANVKWGDAGALVRADKTTWQKTTLFCPGLQQQGDAWSAETSLAVDDEAVYFGLSSGVAKLAK